MKRLKPHPLPVLMVIETEDEAYVGTIEIRAETVVVRDGFVGHPRYIPYEEVLSITRADLHPDVVLL